MKKKHWKNLIAAALLIVFMIFGAGCGGSEKGTADTEKTVGETEISDVQSLAQIEKETAAGLIGKLSSADEIGPGNEWSIMAIARSSLAQDPGAQAVFTKYYDSLRLAVKKNKGALDPDRPTDNARAAVALKMCGYDPKDIEGYDLLEQLEDVEAVRGQGINAEIWALIAAGVCRKQLDAEDAYLNDIYDMQGPEGGITYDGENHDVDITAMSIQALAPIVDHDDKAVEVTDAAISWLSSMQSREGNYGNTESTSQVILAISSMGDDPLQSETFVKEGKTLLDGLIMYRRADGFSHKDEKNTNVMSTEQAACAIDALVLAKEGNRFFE